MKFTCGLNFTLPLVLVLLLVVATKGHTVLQCYVCDNCEKVDKTTPLQKCGGENFSMTTTTTRTTSMSPSESTTKSSSENFSTTTMRSTSMTPSDSTIKPPSAEDPTTTNTTVVELTLPSVNGFTSTTINPLVSAIILDAKNATSNASRSTISPSFFVTPSSEGRSFIDEETGLVMPSSSGNSTEETHNRQRRHTEFNGITYYCYKIQKKYDNVFGTKRGCIGVKTELSVCDELDSSNNNQTSKCSPCTNTMCNGSSAIGVSLATTLLIALLALIYKV